MIEGKPNFFTVADISSCEYNPPKLLVSSGKNHYTNKGIIKNQKFSMNIPSDDMLNYHALKDVDSSFIDHCPRNDGSYTIFRCVTSRGSRGR